MTVYGLLLAAWDAARADKWRGGLSAISIVLGVTAVCAVLASGEIARAALVAEIERTTGRAATLEMSLVAPDEAAGREYWVNASERLAHLDGLIDVGTHSPFLDVSGSISTGNSDSQTNILGISPAYAEIRRLEAIQGRWIQDSDQQAAGLVVVVNELAAESIDIGVLPATAMITVDSPVAGTIVGVVSDRAPQPQIYVGWADLVEWTAGALASQPPRFLIHASTDTFESKQQILEADFQTAFQQEIAIRRVDNVDQVQRLIRIAQLSIGAIGFISIVIGVVGIINVGLASVRERSRELAVRRSFGASSQDVFRLVLLEAALIGFWAGIAGVLAAVALTFALMGVLDVPPHPDMERFPVWIALVGVAVGTMASVLGALVPARRATKLSVVEGIRR